MPTYVALVNFTEQGVQNFGDTAQRAQNFRAMARRARVSVRNVFWTLGRYDGLLVLESPDELSVTAVMLALGSLGNVRTETLRAFQEAEIGQILERVPGGSGAAMRNAGGGGGNGGAMARGGRRGGTPASKGVTRTRASRR
jgi:uncharacterized protein with GYD domain